MAHVTTHRLMRLKRVTKGSPAASSKVALTVST